MYKNPNNVELVDGRWYSLVAKYPRDSHSARWDEDNQFFEYQGTSETKIIPVDEVDEIFGEVNPDALPEGITSGLI